MLKAKGQKSKIIYILRWKTFFWYIHTHCIQPEKCREKKEMHCDCWNERKYKNINKS